MPASQERVNGELDSFYDEDTGAVTQTGLAPKFDFYHQGANVEFVLKDKINYLKVTTPSGRVIINDIKKGHQ